MIGSKRGPSLGNLHRRLPILLSYRMKSNPPSKGRARSARPLRPARPSLNAPSTHRRSREIIEAAARVFAELGYYGATTQKIADVLGMRQASLYYYLPSKEAALEQVCEAGVAGYVETAKAIAEGPGTAGGAAGGPDQGPYRAKCGPQRLRAGVPDATPVPAGREPEADRQMVENAGRHHRGRHPVRDGPARVPQGRRPAARDARDPWNVQRGQRLVPEGKRLDRTDRGAICCAGAAGACCAWVVGQIDAAVAKFN